MATSRGNRKFSALRKSADEGQSFDEAWWQRPCGNQRVAAFHVGRLVNQLRWHAERLWLGGRSADDRAVIQVFDQLLASAHDLSAELAPWLQRRKESWQQTVASEQAAEDFQQLREDLSTIHPELRPDRRESMLQSHVEPLVAEILAAIRRAAPQEVSAAFELGLVLDQGVRPLAIPEHGFDPDTSSSSSQMTAAGEVTPDSSWPLQVAKLCGSSGISATDVLPAAVTADLAAKAPVDEADQKIRARLATDSTTTSSADWCHAADVAPPAEYRHGPLTGRKADLARWICAGRGDPRALEKACRDGRYWARRLSRYEFEIWFRSNDKYKQSREKQLNAKRK